MESGDCGLARDVDVDVDVHVYMYVDLYICGCLYIHVCICISVCMYEFSFIARTSGGYKINIRMRGDMPWLVTDLDRCPAKRGNNCNTRVGSI